MMRLMSFCTQPTVPAKKAVVAPITVITSMATGAWLISGDMRTIMNTPAATMVAAWMRAEIGVGPSIASASQVCRKNCADLPIAPMNSRIEITSSAGKLVPNSA